VAGVEACQNLQKERYALKEDTMIVPFHQPGSLLDPLTEIAWEGARRMLMAALKAEADSFVARFGEELLPDGRQRVVRHGAGPEREIRTGIGPIPVQRQKVRDRATGVAPDAKIRFSSSILPKWARRSKSLDALLPALYLRGISTGGVQEALTALLGADAPNLSPGVMSRLTADCQSALNRDPVWASRRDPLFGMLNAVVAAAPSRRRGGGATAALRVWWGGQARFLKRRLSLPVSTMSQ